MTTVVNLGEAEEPKKGLYFGGNRPKPPESDHKWKVVCLDLNDGHVLWSQTAHEGVPATPIHLKNSYASETPVTDGERLYAYFGNVGVFCYDFDGKLLWQHDIEPHKMRYGWGTAASPVVFQGRLYLVNDNDDDSYLLALDAKTGEQIFRVERDEKSNWATPYIWKNSQRTELVVPATGKVRSLRPGGPAAVGAGRHVEHHHRHALRRRRHAVHQLGLRARQVEADLRDPPRSLGRHQSGRRRDVQRVHRLVEPRRRAVQSLARCCTATYLYVLYDRGFFACFDAKTGEPVYEKKRIPDGKAFTASPWAYDDKIFCLNEDGVTFVIAAGKDFEILHTNKLAEDDMCMATPSHRRRQTADTHVGPGVLHREVIATIDHTDPQPHGMRAGGREIDLPSASWSH